MARMIQNGASNILCNIGQQINFVMAASFIIMVYLSVYNVWCVENSKVYIYLSEGLSFILKIDQKWNIKVKEKLLSNLVNGEKLSVWFKDIFTYNLLKYIRKSKTDNDLYLHT